MIAAVSHNTTEQTVRPSVEPPQAKQPVFQWGRRTLRRAQPGFIGVDIGSRCLKMAQVELSSDGLRIRAARVIEREHVPHNADDRDGSALGAILREAVDSTDCEGHTIACVLPNSCYQETSLDVEPTSEIPAEEQIVRQLGKSGSADDIAKTALDFWKLPPEPSPASPSRESYRIVTIPGSVVENIGTELQKAGFRIHSLDGPAMTRARCAEIADPFSSQGIVAVLDWGYSAATFTFLVRGVPVFSRSLRDSGYSRLLHIAARELGLKETHADVLLRRYGLPGDERTTASAPIRQTLFETLRPGLHQLGEELNRTVTYLERKFSQWRTERLLLIGGGAALRHAAHWLTQATGLEARCWSPPAFTQFGGLGGTAPLFANAVALSALSLSPFRE